MSRIQSSVEENPCNNLDGLSVAYTNHKGIKLPLKNVKDFREAIKSAKYKGQNYLNLIFYDHNLKPHEATALNNNTCTITGRFSKSQIIMPYTDTVSNSSSKDEEACEGPFPEWFKQYMKKFKKEILKDLKSNIAQMVHEEFEKEKKLTEGKLIKPLPEKNESSSPSKEFKRKKRSSVKSSLDLLEKREVKLLKKIEMVRLSKFVRMMSPVLQLEKLEDKTRALLDEKRKLERGCQSKSKNAKKTKKPEKQNLNKKSAIFRDSDIFLFLQPGAEFSVTVNILNNGTVPWVLPRMECLNAHAICLKEHLINLPRLEPGQSVNATLRGKVSQRLGNYYFLYQLFDGLEEFVGPLFTCFAVVSDSKEEVISNSSKQLKPDNKAIPSENLVGTLIDFEKNVIASSQKKIKENINEIERRLQDIDLFRPCTTGDESKEAGLNNTAGKFEITGCDLLQGEERNCWKERLQKEANFEVNPLQQKDDTEKSKQMDGNVKSDNSQTKKTGTESDSDSELSIIFMSEEEENFFFLPSLPESPNSETANDTTKLYLNRESNEASEKLKEDIVEGHEVKTELKEVRSEGVSTSESCLPRRSLTEEEEFSKILKPSAESIFTHTNEVSPGVNLKKNLRENVPGNVSFKIFEETDFPPHNTTFNVSSKDSPVDRSLTGETSSSRNKQTGNKTNCDQGVSHYAFDNTQYFNPSQDIKTNNTERKGHRINIVPTSDRFGNPIYAVRNDGYCLPVIYITQNEAGTSDAVEIVEIKEEAQNEVGGKTNGKFRKGNAMEGSTVNTIPNVLMNGASNVASMAFNTAKFVINNLQSALKPEVETMPEDNKKCKQPEEVLNNFPYDVCFMGEEERQYLEELENLEKYLDARLTLLEMGFENEYLNFQLLRKFDSDVTSVINEILDLSLEDTP